MGKLRDWKRLDKHIDGCIQDIQQTATKPSWFDSIDPDTPIESDIKSLSTSEIGKELSV